MLWNNILAPLFFLPLSIFLLSYIRILRISTCILFFHAGIRVQSLKKGQIIMDIDFRWGGDPNIVLGVEAALVASIPIQVRLSRIFLCWVSHSYKNLSKLSVITFCFSWRIFRFSPLFVLYSNSEKRFPAFLLLLLPYLPR